MKNEHSEKNADAIGDIPVGEATQITKSISGSETISRLPQVLSRPIALISSHRYDAWSVFKMCGREKRDV